MFPYISMIYSVRMRATGPRGKHISGAEGLHVQRSLGRAIRGYLNRALTHPRGLPEEIHITIEPLRHKPREIEALPLRTLPCTNPREADRTIHAELRALGISTEAVAAALRLLRRGPVIQGAALMDSLTGRRREPDPRRGVRARMLGVAPGALAALKRRLARLGLNNTTVLEALVLASKVASVQGVIAELCISDDPDYTTGYVASRKGGYRRITEIKKSGSSKGGRVFFLKPGADVDRIIHALRQRAAVVTRIGK